jgi:hypothetical protein
MSSRGSESKLVQYGVEIQGEIAGKSRKAASEFGWLRRKKLVIRLLGHSPDGAATINVVSKVGKRLTVSVLNLPFRSLTRPGIQAKL